MNLKKMVVLVVSAAFAVAVFAQVCFAVLLLDDEKALAQMFPDVDEVIQVAHTLTAAEVTAIKARLGGNLVHFQVGSQAGGMVELMDYTFYVGNKGGTAKSVSVIEEQPGKWGPVKFIVAIDVVTGQVSNLAVMEYSEKRGRPIARSNFLNQFIGKSSTDPISVSSGKGVKKDIRAISGATISSDCTCFAVRKAIALYEEVYVKALLAGN